MGLGEGGLQGGGMRQVGNVGGREYGSWGVGEVEQVGSGGGGEGGDGEGGDGEGRGGEGGGGGRWWGVGGDRGGGGVEG